MSFSFSIVQQNQSNVGATNPATVAFSSPVAAGNLIVVAVYDGAGASDTITSSDNINGSHHLDLQGALLVDSDSIACFSFSGTAAGTTTVTVGHTAAGNARIAIYEVHDSTGAFPTGPADKTAPGYNAASNAPLTSATATLSQANSFVFGFGGTAGNPAFSAGSGFTLLSDGLTTPQFLGTEWKGVASTAGVTASFGLAASDEWFCGCCVYKGFSASTVFTPFSPTQFFVTDTVVQS